MKKAKFERKDHTMRELPAGERKVFNSINAAKRESRKIQMNADGGLGRGTVRVVK